MLKKTKHPTIEPKTLDLISPKDTSEVEKELSPVRELLQQQTLDRKYRRFLLSILN